jgi:thymidine kinase
MATTTRSTQAGRLEVICGPMFAGKTTELMRRIGHAESLGLAVAVLRPSRDTRSMHDSIETHDGQRHQARETLHAGLVAAHAGSAPVIAIDEAHFFGEPLLQPCMALVAEGRRVIVAGIDLDHFGLLFEPFPALLAAAHEVVRLQGTCARCGAPSTRTQRLVASTARIVVGGAESYEPRCAACFAPSVP